MPDWVLWIPRLFWTPVRWSRGRLRRFGLDRRALVREGSAVVTPVLQFVKTIGPTSVTWGTYEEKRAYLEEQDAKWPAMRDALMAYANQHPSDQVRALAKDVEKAVALDLHNTAFLLGSQRTEHAYAAFQSSDETHTAALEKVEQLIEAIRRY
jgi:hypothetical protein